MNKVAWKEYWLGTRVQVPAWSELWATGDRYGEVIAPFRPWHYDRLLKVKLDKSGRVTVFNADDLEVIS
jgi:hypothetical protein